MGNGEITISAQTLLQHIQRFKALGGALPEGQLLGRWDIAEEMLEKSDRRFPMALVATSVEFASRQLQDPVIGLTMIDRDELPNTAIFELLKNNASTLEDFIRITSRYFCIFSEIGVYRVQHRKPYSEVMFCARDRKVTSHHQVDGAVLLAAKLIDEYAGIKPQRVDIDHAPPENCDAIYMKKFGCPVRFSQPDSLLVYPVAEMTRMRRASAEQLIAPGLEQQRDQLYGRDLIDKTEFLIRRLLIRGEPKRETIAKSLALSLRSFQRELSSRNTTYKELLEHTRQQMADELLRESSFTVQEIALLLGYTETSQFYKAFRRWFSKTPSEYRSAIEQQD